MRKKSNQRAEETAASTPAGRSPVAAAATTHMTKTSTAVADVTSPRVIDHGPGLPADERERVFLPFQRSGDQNGPPGIGLGLALSKGLAEAMGGSLEADDTPGGGLTMDLALPAAPALTAPDGASALQAAETEHPELLILDLGLPDTDGVDVIRSLRAWTDVPIIVLSTAPA